MPPAHVVSCITGEDLQTWGAQIFLFSGIRFAPERDSISSFQDYCLDKHSWKRCPEKRAICASLVRLTEMRDPWESTFLYY